MLLLNFYFTLLLYIRHDSCMTPPFAPKRFEGFAKYDAILWLEAGGGADKTNVSNESAIYLFIYLRDRSTDMMKCQLKELKKVI